MIFLVPARKNSKIILNNHVYTTNRKFEGKTMWLCSQYQKRRCKARIISFGKTIKITADHNHLPGCPDKSRAVSKIVTIIRSVPSDFSNYNDFTY